jgi:predicted ATPase
MENAMNVFLVPALPQAQQDSTRRYTTHEWEEQMPVIKRLYIEEGRKLQEVISTLAESGFVVT